MVPIIGNCAEGDTYLGSHQGRSVVVDAVADHGLPALFNTCGGRNAYSLLVMAAIRLVRMPSTLNGALFRPPSDRIASASAPQPEKHSVSHGSDDRLSLSFEFFYVEVLDRHLRLGLLDMRSCRPSDPCRQSVDFKRAVWHLFHYRALPPQKKSICGAATPATVSGMPLANQFTNLFSLLLFKGIARLRCGLN